MESKVSPVHSKRAEASSCVFAAMPNYLDSTLRDFQTSVHHNQSFVRNAQAKFSRDCFEIKEATLIFEEWISFLGRSIRFGVIMMPPLLNEGAFGGHRRS